MRLIDADALSVTMKIPLMKVGSRYMIDYWHVTNMIEKAPTIDAEPVRHGKFIGTEYDGYADGNPVYYEWKCSECGCIFEEDEPTYRYCPNCGARMYEE